MALYSDTCNNAVYISLITEREVTSIFRGSKVMSSQKKVKNIISYCCIIISFIALSCLVAGCSAEDTDMYLSAKDDEFYAQRNMFAEIPHTGKSLIWDRQSTHLVYDQETYTVYYLIHAYYSYIPVPYYIDGHIAKYDPETDTINPVM